MNNSGSQRESHSIEMLQDCKSLGWQQGLEIYVPKKELHIKDDQNKIQIFHIGRKNNLPTKTILLIGETGAGKTTLANALYNHFFGVKFQDEYRLKLFAEEDSCQDKKFYDSQTENINGYLIYTEPFMKYNYNFMLIDTPGLNDTRGCTKQKEIIKQMVTFLRDDKFGIDEINCLAFVAKASYNRNLEYFGKIIESCLKLFGKDTENITHILKTYGIDKNSNIREIFEDKWDIKTENEFNFDNGILYEPNKEGEEDHYGNVAEKLHIDMRALRWENQDRESHSFFQILAMMPSVSLKLTKAVLNEKAYLEQAKINLTEKIKSVLTELAVGRVNANMYRNYEKYFEEKTAWEGTEVLIHKERVPLNKGSVAQMKWFHFCAHVHNCVKCNKTCVNVCHIWIPCPKLDAPCIICKCKNSDHKKEDEIIKESVTMRIVTDKDIKAKIANLDIKGDIQKILSSIKEEEQMLREAIATMVKHVCLQTERLNEISRVKTCQSPKEIIEEIISNITQNPECIRSLLNEDSQSFLQAIVEDVEKIEVNKEAWIKELEQMVTESEMARQRSGSFVNRVASMSRASQRLHRRITHYSQKSTCLGSNI
ncbi:uncharacterized protein [Palaemon carinicauda]|uniref:uncharacterized protein n=1 Tax=Palaemon carinicauda TaxID=392227 RepID=UPI0035B5A2FB